MSDDNDNGSNQSSNSNDNYQQMPDEEEERRKQVVVVIPDLAPPPSDAAPDDPVIHIDDPGYAAPDHGHRHLLVAAGGDQSPHDEVPPDMGPPETPVDEPPPHGDETEDDPIIRITDPGQPVSTNPADPWTPPPDDRTDRTERPTTPQAPSGTMDEGFWVWLSHHGVRPGDPAMKGRIPEFLANYQSLPEWDHAEYRAVGKRHPEGYNFNTKEWADSPGLPSQVPGGPTGGPPDELPPEDVPPYEPQPTPDPITDPGWGMPEQQARPAAAAPETSRYDWQGRRLGRRYWDSRQGRWV